MPSPDRSLTAIAGLVAVVLIGCTAAAPQSTSAPEPLASSHRDRAAIDCGLRRASASEHARRKPERRRGLHVRHCRFLARGRTRRRGRYARSSSRAPARCCTTCPTASRTRRGVVCWLRPLTGRRRPSATSSSNRASVVRPRRSKGAGDCRRSAPTRRPSACPRTGRRRSLSRTGRPPTRRPLTAGSPSSRCRSSTAGPRRHRGSSSCPARSSTTLSRPTARACTSSNTLPGHPLGTTRSARSMSRRADCARRSWSTRPSDDEAMAGYPIAQLRRADGMVFTLYQGAEHPFIHALESTDAWALCIDLPTSNAAPASTTSGPANRDWGVASMPGGQSLVAANATLGLAVKIGSDLTVGRVGRFDSTASEAVTLAKFGHTPAVTAGQRVAIAPNGSAVYAAGSNGVVRLRPDDLTFLGRLLPGVAVTSLAVTRDRHTPVRAHGRWPDPRGRPGDRVCREGRRRRRFRSAGGRRALVAEAARSQPTLTHSWHSPRMTRSRVVLVALVVVVALVIGGYVAYDQVLRGDSVSALALPSANASTAPAASSAAASGTASSAAPADRQYGRFRRGVRADDRRDVERHIGQSGRLSRPRAARQPPRRERRRRPDRQGDRVDHARRRAVRRRP